MSNILKLVNHYMRYLSNENKKVLMDALADAALSEYAGRTCSAAAAAIALQGSPIALPLLYVRWRDAAHPVRAARGGVGGGG